MEDQETGELRDYKFFCFNGEPKLMFVATERGVKNTKFDFYDMQFNHMNIVQHYPNSVSAIKKPEHFEKMIELAKKLSEDVYKRQAPGQREISDFVCVCRPHFQ